MKAPSTTTRIATRAAGVVGTAKQKIAENGTRKLHGLTVNGSTRAAPVRSLSTHCRVYDRGFP